MKSIAPCIWFDKNAEEAVKFYVSVFKNSKIDSVSHYGDGMHMPNGTVLAILFAINGQDFMALNGGPGVPHSNAVSFMVNCDTQAELDDYWAKLTADGGSEVQCGWLKDKFGLSWQIVPASLPKLLGGDQAQTNRVMAEVMKMIKLDIATMEKAATR